jgi:XTP/dITP diphosphohydrolase
VSAENLKVQNILLATKNPGKIREFKYISNGIISFITLLEVKDNNEVKEDGKSFYENALLKAQYYFVTYRMPTLAEDSGIKVEYLKGAPGIYSRRFAAENATDSDNNKKLLKLLEGVPYHQRKATYEAVCVFVCEKFTIWAEGYCEGYIATEEKGNEGFGYDPIFYYPPYEKTFGEVSIELKSKVSHRAMAFRNLIEKLKEKDASYLLK